MEPIKWQAQDVQGRDEVLLDIARRASTYRDTVVQDSRAIMQDYEIDMYRLLLGIGKRYGMDTAYEIMSDTVAEKRLKWLDQSGDELELNGTDVEKGLGLFIKYFQVKEDRIIIIEQTKNKIVFKRKDIVNAISHACSVLGLDVIEVNNKVYARAMEIMFRYINLDLRYTILNYQNDWYNEMIEQMP